MLVERAPFEDYTNPMERVSRYRWALSSIGISVGIALITLAIIQHSFHSGEWKTNSPLGMRVAAVGGVAVVVSFILAVVALFKDESRLVASLALLLSILSVAFYAR
jgi:uncharacterized membrane protein (DUF441 family)